MVIAPRAWGIGSNLAAVGAAPVAKRAANLVQFPFGHLANAYASS
jgi:hypothetical protein